MAATSQCQTWPGAQPSAPNKPSIWVKRWELKWVQAPSSACDSSTPAGCSWQQVAVCTWTEGTTPVPAVKDWPRWKEDGVLPPDEYYEKTYEASYVKPTDAEIASNKCLYGCGLKLEWIPVMKRIETPRAWRWVTPAQASETKCNCLPCTPIVS
jgi:hypothetical protein